MLYLLHNFHFIFHLLVENAVLHELPLVELLGGVRKAIEFGGDLVYRRKGTFSNLAHAVVSVRPIPCFWQVVGPGKLLSGFSGHLRAPGDGLSPCMNRRLENVNLI